MFFTSRQISIRLASYLSRNYIWGVSIMSRCSYSHWSSWSSPWLFRHLGFLPWECWEWARLRDCDWNWTTSCHRHRDHNIMEMIEQTWSDWCRQSLDKRTEPSHQSWQSWSCSGMRSLKKNEEKWGFKYIPWPAKRVHSCCLFLWDCVMATKIRQNSPQGFE